MCNTYFIVCIYSQSLSLTVSEIEQLTIHCKKMDLYYL